MKKLISLTLSLVMIMTTLCALPFSAKATSPGEVIHGISIYIDGNLEAGKQTSVYDGENKNYMKISYSGNNKVMGSTLWVKDPTGNYASNELADDQLYYDVYYSMNVFDESDVLRSFDTKYTTIYVNGVKILNYTGNVTTKESNGYANAAIEIKVRYYRVSFEDGNLLGYFSPSQEIEVTAPEVSGKHFVKWDAENGNHQKPVFEDVNSKTTKFKIEPAVNKLKPEYEDHTIGADFKCTGCDYVDETAKAAAEKAAAEKAAAEKAAAEAAAKAEAEKAAFLAAKPTLKVKAAKKSAKLSWKAVDGAVTYEIQYSTNKKLKKATIKKVKAAKVAATIKKLKKGKKYYFRIRAVNENGASKWSATKNAKIK